MAANVTKLTRTKAAELRLRPKIRFQTPLSLCRASLKVCAGRRGVRPFAPTLALPDARARADRPLSKRARGRLRDLGLAPVCHRPRPTNGLQPRPATGDPADYAIVRSITMRPLLATVKTAKTRTRDPASPLSPLSKRAGRRSTRRSVPGNEPGGDCANWALVLVSQTPTSSILRSRGRSFHMVLVPVHRPTICSLPPLPERPGVSRRSYKCS